MYNPTTLLVLAAAGASAFSLAERDISLIRRAAGQGWSVQSPSSTSGLVSCGSNAYCPANSYCFDAKNSEVASCCSSNSPCVGAVEGAPTCADPSWNMYSGIDGNGFCCVQGMVGVIDRQARTMGCVASNAVGSSSTAVLTMSGTGSASTAASSASSSSASSSASSAASSAASSSSPASTTTDSAASTSTLVAPVVRNGTTDTSSSSSSAATPSNTSSGSSAATNGKEIAMGVVAFGLMAVAAAL